VVMPIVSSTFDRQLSSAENQVLRSIITQEHLGRQPVREDSSCSGARIRVEINSGQRNLTSRMSNLAAGNGRSTVRFS